MDMFFLWVQRGLAICSEDDDGPYFIVDLEGNILRLPEGVTAGDLFYSDGLLAVKDAYGRMAPGGWAIGTAAWASTLA